MATNADSFINSVWLRSLQPPIAIDGNLKQDTSTTILNCSDGEFFGFVHTQIDMMLQHYGLTDQTGRIRKWYNGYRVGSAQVYNSEVL